MDAPTINAATSATWNYPNGRTITIEHEAVPGFTIRRPTRIHGGAVLVPFPGRDGTLRPCAIQDEETWNLYKENSFEGGHLLALSLGGPDHHFNIAPMNKGANGGSGVWGRIEGEIRRTIKGSILQLAHIDIRISYSDMIDPTIPHRVKAQINGALYCDLEIRPPVDHTNIVGKNISALFRDIEMEAGTAGLVGTPEAPHTPLDVIDRNSVAAQALRDRIRTIPILASYPRTGIKRKSYKGKPSKEQRLLMMLYNRYRNKGLLMAEDPLNLGFMLNEWRVQADHIKPYSKNGNRQYKNLRLLHHRTNNKRGAGNLTAAGRIKRVSKPPNRYGH